VLNEKGKISRWELLFEKNKCQASWRHIHKNSFKPFTGIGFFPYIHKHFLWRARLEAFIEGDKNSISEKMINFIKTTPDSYPNLERYTLIGPNSNTYCQYVLDHFPEFKGSLPFNSVGKRYHR